MSKLFNRIVFAHIVCALALSVNSCKKEDVNDKESVWGYESKNKVTRYVFPESMSLMCDYESSCVIFRAVVDGMVVGHGLTAHPNYKNLTEEDVAMREKLFDSMAVVYKDTAYNGMVSMTGNWALAYSIDSISIVMDKEYDRKHPMGTSLSDVVNARITSYGECVFSGYEKKLIGFEKKVSELTQLNRTLMATSEDHNCSQAFYIPQTDTPKDCQLTVTYFFSNGLNLSASAQVKL